MEPIYNTTQQACNNLQLTFKINKSFLLVKLANPQHYEHSKTIFLIFVIYFLIIQKKKPPKRFFVHVSEITMLFIVWTTTFSSQHLLLY